jgi:hypothetical protein
MSTKQRADDEPAEQQLSDYEKNYAVHADPNRERWSGGLYDVAPAEDAGGGVPQASSLAPTRCAIGAPDFTLTVNGVNFAADTLIVFDGVAIVTDFVSPTELDCDIHPGAFVDARVYPVTVQSGDGTVNPAVLDFLVTAPAERGQPQPAHAPKKNRKR